MTATTEHSDPSIADIEFVRDPDGVDRPSTFASTLALIAASLRVFAKVADWPQAALVAGDLDRVVPFLDANPELDAQLRQQLISNNA